MGFDFDGITDEGLVRMRLIVDASESPMARALDQEIDRRSASYQGPGVYRWKGKTATAIGTSALEGEPEREMFVIFQRPDTTLPRADYTLLPLGLVNGREEDGSRSFTYVGSEEQEQAEAEAATTSLSADKFTLEQMILSALSQLGGGHHDSKTIFDKVQEVYEGAGVYTSVVDKIQVMGREGKLDKPFRGRYQLLEDYQPASANSDEAAQKHHEPLPGAVVGAIWEKGTGDSGSGLGGQAVVTHVDDVQGFVWFARSWDAPKRKVSFKTLKNNRAQGGWSFVSYGKEVYNLRGWVFETVSKGPCTRQDLVEKSKLLVFKNRKVDKRAVDGAVSGLVFLNLVGEDSSKVLRVTDSGRAELGLRAAIVDVLGRFGPLTISDVTHYLSKRYGRPISEENVGRSLNSLEASRYVSHDGPIWKAADLALVAWT